MSARCTNLLWTDLVVTLSETKGLRRCFAPLSMTNGKGICATLN